MLTGIWYRFRLGAPWISLLLILASAIVWVATLADPGVFHVFATYARPRYFWQVFSGLVQHGISPDWFVYAHFLTNVIVMAVIGIPVERLVGTLRFALLCVASALAVYAIFFLTAGNGNSSIYGLSAIAWSPIPVALYLLWKSFRAEGLRAFRDAAVTAMLVVLFIVVAVLPFVVTIDTNIIHAIALSAGIVFLLVMRRDIDGRITECRTSHPESRCRLGDNSVPVGLIAMLPLGAMLVLGWHFTFGLDRIFARLVASTPCQTARCVNDNDGRLDLVFDTPLTQNGITSRHTSFDVIGVNYEIGYSEDRRTVTLVFDKELPESACGVITLNRAEFENGKFLRPLTLRLCPT